MFDDFRSGYRHNVKWGPLVEGDIANRQVLREAFETFKPKAVMHFAAHIEVGEGERDPLGYFQNNVGGTLALLDAMREADVRTIVFSSTCAVHGSQTSPPLSEKAPRAPMSVYGQTKAMVEDVLEQCARASGLSGMILRYFNASGADPNGELGEEHDPETHLIPNALRAAAGLGPPLRLFGTDYRTPDGTCLRDYVHVSDLATAHVAALERALATPKMAAFNLGTGNPHSVKQVIDVVARITGREVPFEVHERRPGDVASLYADPSAACRELNFVFERSNLDTIVGDAWRFYRPRWRLGSPQKE